jgi:hypothetical protein
MDYSESTGTKKVVQLLLNFIESVNIRGDGKINMAFSLCVFVVNSLVGTHRKQSHL